MKNKIFKFILAWLWLPIFALVTWTCIQYGWYDKFTPTQIVGMIINLAVIYVCIRLLQAVNRSDKALDKWFRDHQKNNNHGNTN